MAKKHGDDCPLTADELPRFKKMLLAKQREILGNVMSMENETLRRARSDLSNLPYHMADLGSDNFELENTLGLVDSERRILEEIEDALIRIDDGTYGICEGNGEAIPKARLEAIPWARYCVKCASLAEMGLLGGQDIYDDSDY
jgi:DnaK suppressor protein